MKKELKKKCRITERAYPFIGLINPNEFDTDKFSFMVNVHSPDYLGGYIIKRNEKLIKSLIDSDDYSDYTEDFIYTLKTVTFSDNIYKRKTDWHLIYNNESNEFVGLCSYHLSQTINVESEIPKYDEKGKFRSYLYDFIQCSIEEGLNVLFKN